MAPGLTPLANDPMNVDELRACLKSADGESEIVILSSDTGHVYELVTVTRCMNDRVVLFHAKHVTEANSGSGVAPITPNEESHPPLGPKPKPGRSRRCKSTKPSIGSGLITALCSDCGSTNT